SAGVTLVSHGNDAIGHCGQFLPSIVSLTCAAGPTPSFVRSGESSADKPPLLAATSPSRLQDALESVCLEQGNRPYIRGGLVNAVAGGVHWVTLNHDCAAGACVLNCAVQQVVHQPTAPEPRSHPEADR